eukprot:scaffold30544_cov49-Phaeocystis_antarctica.AAC.3
MKMSSKLSCPAEIRFVVAVFSCEDSSSSSSSRPPAEGPAPSEFRGLSLAEGPPPSTLPSMLPRPLALAMRLMFSMGVVRRQARRRRPGRPPPKFWN